MHKLFAVAVPVAITACATTHVQLPEPPGKSGPFEDRAAYYDEHKPIAADRVTTVSMYGKAPIVQSGIPFLQLANGTRVVWVEDLRPAVDAASPTARALDESVEARASADAWMVGGAAGIAAGILVVLAAIPLASATRGPEDNGMNVSVLLGGVVAGAGLSLVGSVPLLVSFIDANRAAQARETAFTTFDASLKKKLGLKERAKEHEFVDDREEARPRSLSSRR